MPSFSTQSAYCGHQSFHHCKAASRPHFGRSGQVNRIPKADDLLNGQFVEDELGSGYSPFNHEIANADNWPVGADIGPSAVGGTNAKSEIRSRAAD
ncbi:hypothetical protein E0H32_07685 [Rhizobium leguminosarum bv. viciae]|nr:hypothetical protein E0H32_07685 [Rhizobium leguminosarum bv. viciae]